MTHRLRCTGRMGGLLLSHNDRLDRLQFVSMYRWRILTLLILFFSNSGVCLSSILLILSRQCALPYAPARDTHVNQHVPDGYSPWHPRAKTIIYHSRCHLHIALLLKQGPLGPLTPRTRFDGRLQRSFGNRSCKSLHRASDHDATTLSLRFGSPHHIPPKRPLHGLHVSPALYYINDR